MNDSTRYLILTGALAAMACVPTAASPVRIEQKADAIQVYVGGSLFTEYVQGEQKPYLYPVIGPTGVFMTRKFPMKVGVPGESQDHPWQSSIFYAHGSVNGLDFWNDRNEKQLSSRIVLDELETARNLGSERAVIVATHRWKHGDREIMSDRTEMAFSGDEDKRVIDFRITLIASNGEVVLGDTKEGCMGIRMNPRFRVSDQGASVLNSEGVVGKDVWGRKARWISYFNELEGEVVGISIFDHPNNFRYPTTWHARDYGLCAANCFGLSHFPDGRGESGNLVLADGEEITFSYRFVFHKGTPEEAGVDSLHGAWTTTNDIIGLGQ